MTGSEFTATILEEGLEVGDKEGVRVKVKGQGYYTGSNTLTLEAEDGLGRGFLVHDHGRRGW